MKKIKVITMLLAQLTWQEIKKHVLLWRENDLNKESKEAILTAINWSLKNRFIPMTYFAATEVILFAALHRYGFNIAWLAAFVVTLYWWIADAYLHGHVDLLYRVGFYQKNEEVKMLKEKAAKKGMKPVDKTKKVKK